jgi:hypothetical protein
VRLQGSVGNHFTVQLHTHAVASGGIEWEIDDHDDREIGIIVGGARRGGELQLTTRLPELVSTRTHPMEGECMCSGIGRSTLEAKHEMGTRMQGRKAADLERIEDSQDVQLPFLGQISGVCEDCE